MQALLLLTVEQLLFAQKGPRGFVMKLFLVVMNAGFQFHHLLLIAGRIVEELAQLLPVMPNLGGEVRIHPLPLRLQALDFGRLVGIEIQTIPMNGLRLPWLTRPSWKSRHDE